MESNLVQPEYLPEKYLQVGGIQPNLILGAMLGSEMVFPPGADSDIAGNLWKTLYLFQNFPRRKNCF
jgi:hypothetical protein